MGQQQLHQHRQLQVGSKAEVIHGTSPAIMDATCASGIRLAGATNDVHVFDVRTGRWEKISPQGEPPSPRAAHAAAAVGNMVVIQVMKKAK
jgi:hypothetical protein